MNPVTAANALYMRKDFAAALAAYLRARAELSSRPAAPKSLVAHCESRIAELRTRRDEPRPEQARAWPDAPATVAAPTQTPASPSEVLLNDKRHTELPQVSVVIPHYESLAYLPDALRSLQDQPMKRIEVIIVDDASPNDGPRLEPALRKLGLAYPLRLIRLEHNRGPSYCRNRGIAAARGRVVCFLDADDAVDGNSLASRWELLNGHAAESAAFAPLKYVSKDGTALDQVILAHQEVVAYPDFTSNKFPCSAVAVKRKYLEADRFDETLGSGEDYEFFSRLAQRGVVYRECKGVIYFRQLASSLSHKDVLGDARSRMLVSKHVYGRRLDWVSRGLGGDLATSIRETEVALRSFPVACVLALRGNIEHAATLATEIDLDMVAAVKVRSVADAVRFIVAREFLAPLADVPKLLSGDAPTHLAEFLARSIRIRHLRFALQLLRILLGDEAFKAAEAHLRAKLPLRLATRSYTELKTSDLDFDYVALHAAGERFDTNAAQAVTEYLLAHQHLEGLLLYKTMSALGEPCVLPDSIAPDMSDSMEMTALGERLFPGVVLDRESFLIVRGLLSGQDLTDEQGTYCSILRLLHRLRLKLVGGVPDAFLSVAAEGEAA